MQNWIVVFFSLSQSLLMSQKKSNNSLILGKKFNKMTEEIKRVSFLLKLIFKKCIWQSLNTMFLSLSLNILSDDYIDQIT